MSGLVCMRTLVCISNLLITQRYANPIVIERPMKGKDEERPKCTLMEYHFQLKVMLHSSLFLLSFPSNATAELEGYLIGKNAWYR